ncbi:alkyl sulfatase dimerization domain-containing protein [Bradyrhizobium sp. LHD-71]|uniref:alkyl sulfatase dimerization domain-containing protein n=1 Tax=Bradyrhizobium sp. LHD-71 TaxID=3072141 RepID=UPI0028100138|nr:alkyl sulfatase dimerization domain-containing protein [Bradyrhizobium sp. LHD-71]MDQ8731012.1 alkyl sulfatase dimerization domain-containing protein [Bradyrhizobium sp. LHD-71]
MSDDLRAIGDACWSSFRFPDWQRAIGSSKATQVADDMVYIATRGVVGNITAVRTRDGLVVFDTGSASTAQQIYDTLRGWDAGPIHTVIFTHGHVDHVMGASLFEEEAKRRGHPKIRFIGQRNMPARFRRYVATAGFNTNINGRQFGVPDFQWPKQFRHPDLTYDDTLEFSVGGVTFELNHGLGETDDHTWTWIADRKVIVSGDFVIWAAPNSGNPQKVQRYTKPWAEAFRAMAAKNADILVPGHGPAIFGADRVATLLADGAKFLDTVHDQVLTLMNAGKTLDEIVQAVKIPTDLLTRPYLQPTYDDPEFLVRNIWRLYGGWWDGDPAHLKPASASALATELAHLAGGAAKLAQRAAELAASGDLRLAGHLAEFAVRAEPANADAHRTRIEVNKQRAAAETTVMAKGVFNGAVRESLAVVDPAQLEARPRRNVGIG